MHEPYIVIPIIRCKKLLVCFLLMVLLLSMMTGCNSGVSDVQRTDVSQEILPSENNVQNGTKGKGLVGESNSEPKDTIVSKTGDTSVKVTAAAEGGTNNSDSKEGSTNGYKDVHNLGSINDWPYDKVSGSEDSFYNQ